MALQLEKWKEKRKELNLNYEDLAQKAQVSLNTVKNIFRGATTDPRHETVQAIERALGLTPEPTDEEKALGLVSSTPIVLSDRDKKRLQMLMEADDVLGKERVDVALSMIALAVEAEKEKR